MYKLDSDYSCYQSFEYCSITKCYCVAVINEIDNISNKYDIFEDCSLYT